MPIEVTNIAQLNFPGLIVSGVTRNPPDGYLICDGSAINRSTYARLFNAIVPSLGNVTITLASPGVVTLSGHSLLTGESVYLTTTGALPTGLSANTLYYVIVVDSNTFRLATTYANALAGTAINTSVSQSGTHTLFFCPFGLGNGTTTFNIPDLRSAYLRGRGTSSAFTQNRTSGMGERLNDQEQGHLHVSQYPQAQWSGSAGPGGTVSYENGNWTSRNTGSQASNGSDGTPRTGNENRPNSVVLNYFIRF